MHTGETERLDNVMWFHGEVTVTPSTVRTVPVIGDAYRRESGEVVTITEVGGDTFVIGGTLCNTISLTRWVEDGTLTPDMSASDIAEDNAQRWAEAGSPRDVNGHQIVGNRGAGSADDQPLPFRTSSKHKSTSRSRARRGGNR